jgi:hypothetical protein
LGISPLLGGFSRKDIILVFHFALDCDFWRNVLYHLPHSLSHIVSIRPENCSIFGGKYSQFLGSLPAFYVDFTAGSSRRFLRFLYVFREALHVQRLARKVERSSKKQI